MSNSDAIKRVRKRVLTLAHDCAALFLQFISTEAGSYNALATFHNVLDRYLLLVPSLLGADRAHDIFGVASTFECGPSVVEALRENLVQSRSRVMAYMETLQSLRDSIQAKLSEARQATLLCSVSNPELSLRSVEEPHSVHDCVAYCDTWSSCVAADVMHKWGLLSDLPAVRGLDVESAIATGPDHQAILLRKTRRCLASWVAHSAPADAQALAREAEEACASDKTQGATSPKSVYLESIWAHAGSELWTLQGKELTWGNKSSDS
jgi:hypothetical protein